MSGPPPPPPPPGPPPMPSFDTSSSRPDPNARNMLLQQIHQGARLKKTVTIDKSAPLIDGNRNKSGSSGGLGSGNGGGTGARANGMNVPQGLGGLFAGGMPKLKPVGSPGRRTANSNNETNSSVINKSSVSATNVSYGSDTVSSAITNSFHTSPAKPPPPQPPPSNLKPTLASAPRTVNEDRRINYGKPSVAPKPPINGAKPAKPDPPPKLFIPPPPPPPGPNSTDSASSTPQSGYTSSSMTTPSTPPPSVNRAQSMRMPKSASPTNVIPASSIEYRTMGRAAGRGIASAAGQPPPPPRMVNGGTRPRPSPLRPPTSRPPPPPNKAPPAHPPPPPPAAAPPPPPHRTSAAPLPPQLRVNGSLGPLPPAPLNGPPPPPPTRNSSMRSVASANSALSSSSGSSSSSHYMGVDLEARFGHLFQSLDRLPGPSPFSGKPKSYPSKNAQTQSVKRQPAPQPPVHSNSLTQVQLGPRTWDSVC